MKALFSAESILKFVYYVNIVFYQLTFNPFALLIALSGLRTLRTRRILTVEMAPDLQIQIQVSSIQKSKYKTHVE